MTEPATNPKDTFDPALAPGGHVAVSHGCRCSVLANAAFRSGAPSERPFVDPRCEVHTSGLIADAG